MLMSAVAQQTATPEIRNTGCWQSVGGSPTGAEKADHMVHPVMWFDVSAIHADAEIDLFTKDKQ